MDKIDAILQRFPQYAYDPSNKLSALYKLIKSIVDELDITVGNIDRIDKMIGIDTVIPDDIYNRFGALLSIKQNEGESDEQYRIRLKTSITSLSGGTANAIKYAIISGLGINGDAEAMDKIHVYDAWEYNVDNDSIIRDYGYVVCSIDMNQGDYSPDIENIITKATNDVKAGGVIVQFVYHNFRIVYYMELDNISYISLDSTIYSKVGE